MENIGKIYISREKIGTYGDTTKYFVRKILIENEKGKLMDYISISNQHDKLSKRRKKKEHNEIDAFLKKWATKFIKQQKKPFDTLKNDGSVIVVNSDNLEINQYIDNKIEEYRYFNYTGLQYINIVASVAHTILSIQYTEPFGISLYYSLMGIYFSTYSLSANVHQNLDISKEIGERAEKPIFGHIRLFLAASLLALNTTNVANNVSVNFDQIVPIISDDLEVSKNLIKREFLLKNNENPFTYVEGLENMNLVSSRDAYVTYLMEALALNPFLNENDREIALKLETYLKENPYLDYEKLYDKFSEIFVVHSNQDKGTTAAQNNILINYIETYTYNAYYDSTLFHEFIHSTGNLPYSVLTEGMTELLSAEYFNNGSITGYSGYVNLTKIFCELIGSDKMLEAFSKEDMSIIETELLKLNDDPKCYQELTNLLQKYSESDGSLYSIACEEYYSQFVNAFTPYMNSELVTPEKRTLIEGYLDKRWYPKAYFSSDYQKYCIENYSSFYDSGYTLFYQNNNNKKY